MFEASLLSLILTFIGSQAFAGPLWTSQGTFRRHGNDLTIVCSGHGGNIAQARSEAMNSCVESAGEQLPTTWKLKSKSEETVEDVKLKKEVLADQRIEGLACDVKNEYVDEKSDSSMTVFVQCRFDLAKAKSTALNMEKITAANAVSLDVRPGCDYVYVEGGPYTRHVPCEEGKPTIITLLPDEYEVVIHKNRGYRAKVIKLNRDVTYQEFVVHLERRDEHSDDGLYAGETPVR